MKIYQLKTAEDFLKSIPNNDDWTTPMVMHMFAQEVATKFAAECVNEALGNDMEVSNSLHITIKNKFNSIEW